MGSDVNSSTVPEGDVAVTTSVTLVCGCAPAFVTSIAKFIGRVR